MDVESGFFPWPESPANAHDDAIRVGVSACVMGEAVRFDGSQCRDRFLSDALGRHVEWVKVCPEVGAGMGVPRPTLRLIGSSSPGSAAPRLVSNKDGADWTDAVTAFAEAATDRLVDLDLCGYVVKSRSPTCGMERVRVYDRNGVPQKAGIGVFTAVLMRRCPLLPVEEDGRLRDPALREAFLDAVFAYARWRAFSKSPFTVAQLIDFHSRNKYLLRAHSPHHATGLGQLVASAGHFRTGALARRYGALYMQAMKRRGSPGKHETTMRGIAGHLRPHISDTAHRVVHEAIDDYRAGYETRGVPIALLRHHAEDCDLRYLRRQFYLNPYPTDLRRAA